MKRRNLISIVQSLSVADFKDLISKRGKLESLAAKKASIEKELNSVTKQIASLQNRIGLPKERKPGAKVKSKPKRKRIVQPSLSSLVVQILKEKKKPLKVNEISDALLKEKKYKTQAKNFKANVRIVLYKNDKGLFRKVGPGTFGLTGDREKK